MVESRTRMTLRLPALPALVVLLAGACAMGGEPVVPAGGPQPGAVKAEEPPKEEKKLASDEKPWIFDVRGRRDPFTFSAKAVISDPTPVTPGDINRGPVLEPALIKQKQAEAESRYAEAENIFMEIGKESRALEAMAKCDEGLKVFTDIPNYGAIPEWQPVRARLENLRKASERLKQRHDAEKKFKEVNIRLTGIVVRERGSKAIVSGKDKPVGRGDIVAASENYDVSVDDILQDQVIFVTPDGYKVRAELSK